MNNSILKNENEIKKNKEQKLIEESDNNLCKDLFSNNPHVIDNSSGISIIKIGKDKFISVVNKKLTPVINIETNVNINKKHSRCYDLNDFDCDCDF
jgi:hypothetical protein